MTLSGIILNQMDSVGHFLHHSWQLFCLGVTKLLLLRNRPTERYWELWAMLRISKPVLYRFVYNSLTNVYDIFVCGLLPRVEVFTRNYNFMIQAFKYGIFTSSILPVALRVVRPVLRPGRLDILLLANVMTSCPETSRLIPLLVNTRSAGFLSVGWPRLLCLSGSVSGRVLSSDPRRESACVCEYLITGLTALCTDSSNLQDNENLSRHAFV